MSRFGNLGHRLYQGEVSFDFVGRRKLWYSMSAIIAGFEEEPSRVAARVAQQVQGTAYKATVFGYGISTTPELAAFANGCQVRVCDFNDNPDDPSVMERLHATGDMNAVLASGGRDPLLFNLFAGPYKAGEASHFYGSKRNPKKYLFDQICVSPGMLDEVNWSCDPKSATVRSAAAWHAPRSVTLHT